MMDEWTPIQNVQIEGGPEAVERRLHDGLLIARAKLAVIFYYPLDEEKGGLDYANPVTERYDDYDLPASAWGRPPLNHKSNLWTTGEATCTWSLDPAYEVERTTLYQVELRNAELGSLPPHVAMRVAPAPAADPQPQPVKRNEGGRPPVYDWERAVAAIVFQWADEGSWQPASQADVKNKLAEWFAAKGEYPSDSLLKTRARWLFEEFQRRNGEANNFAA